VGTGRRALAVAWAGRVLVGPDNGILTAFLDRPDEIRVLENESLFLPDVSPTFHGRDVFAPVAARLAGGLPFKEVGPVLSDAPVLLDDLETLGDRGVVLHVDRFGNLVTSFPAETLLSRPGAKLEGPDAVVEARAKTFLEAEPGEPFLYAGSGGRLEVAVPLGSASRHLGWDRGTPVTFAGESA
jgi:S-adenosylmethionine hydrolase